MSSRRKMSSRREVSFWCAFCGKPQPKGIEPIWVKTKIRRTPFTQTYVFGEDDPEKRWPLAVVSSDYKEEIVEIRKACPGCAKEPIEPEVELIE
jgi:hypothetical protein